MTGRTTEQTYLADPRTWFRRALIAPALLFSLILIIGVGPRISLGFVDAEIRIQDALLPPILLYLVFSRKPVIRLPLDRMLGLLLPVFLWASFIVVVIGLFFYPEVSIFRRVTYYGRTIEMFVLAAVVTGLYLRSGHRAMKTVLTAVTVGAFLNMAWFAFQLASGSAETLVGQEFGAQVESYGPKLIGEPSPFGTGQYWAFVGAIAAARIKSRYRIPLSIVLLIVALAGAWLAESRISVGSILVVVAVLLILGRDSRRSINFIGILSGLVIGLIGLIQLIPNLEGRLSPALVQQGFDFRVDNIWAPFVETLLASPLIGVGPGGITGDTYLSEAHNIALRAMLDFGIPVGLVFIALFIRALVSGFSLARTENIDQVSRLAGYVGALCIVSTFVSGLVQDSLTAVMPAHLTMVAVGVLAAQRGIWISKRDTGAPAQQGTPSAAGSQET